MRAKMTRFLTSNQQKFSELLYYALCIFLIILVSACSDAQYISSETGSIAFSVEWRGAPQESSGRYAAALDCDAAGVATVVAEVYDESSLYLTAGGPWLCSAHTGTIQNVPAGSGRTAVVLGKDINGDVLYRGVKRDALKNLRNLFRQLIIVLTGLESSGCRSFAKRAMKSSCPSLSLNISRHSIPLTMM
jgi:hypothetical protein